MGEARLDLVGDVCQEWSRAVAVSLPAQSSSGRQVPAVAAPEHPSSPGRGRKRAEGHTIVLPTAALGECRANRREPSAFLCLCWEYFH